MRHHVGDDGRHRGRVGDVGAEPDRPVAELCGGVAGGLGVEVDEGHAGTSLDQLSGGLEADAPGRAGDQRDLVLDGVLAHEWIASCAVVVTRPARCRPRNSIWSASACRWPGRRRRRSGRPGSDEPRRSIRRGPRCAGPPSGGAVASWSPTWTSSGERSREAKRIGRLKAHLEHDAGTDLVAPGRVRRAPCSPRARPVRSAPPSSRESRPSAGGADDGRRGSRAGRAGREPTSGASRRTPPCRYIASSAARPSIAGVRERRAAIRPSATATGTHVPAGVRRAPQHDPVGIDTVEVAGPRRSPRGSPRAAGGTRRAAGACPPRHRSRGSRRPARRGRRPRSLRRTRGGRCPWFRRSRAPSRRRAGPARWRTPRRTRPGARPRR